MTANTPQTRKAKGRQAVKEVKARLLDVFSLPDGDIIVMPTSVPGDDLKLSPEAQKKIPFSFEVKCQESLQFWEAIRQTEWNASKVNRHPALVFRRNHEKFRVVIDFELFLSLVLKSYACQDTSAISSTPISSTQKDTRPPPESINGPVSQS